MSYINIHSGADQELAQRLLATNFAGTELEGTPETEHDRQTGIVVTGDSFSVDHHTLATGDDAKSNGYSQVQRYALEGCTVFVESGENDGLHIYPVNTSIHTMLLDWDFGDLETCEFMAEWGFDATPDEASETATDVRIWCEPNYYAGTFGAPVGHFVTDGEKWDDARVFATYAEAQEWIDAEEDGAYHTSHGEAGRPAYTICE